VQIATLDLGLVNHTAVTGRQFLDRLLEGARSTPGAQSVALTHDPTRAAAWGLGGIQVEGRRRRS
jgi:uncharacterized protein YbjT (DUF2867 family)